MSYFVADDKLPVLQTNISIPSENGLTYNQNQVIEISVPAGTKFINPKETNLMLTCLISNPSGNEGVRTQLDAEIGGNCLIKDFRVWDGNKNTLLEEILDWDVQCAMTYSYHKNDSLINKRGLLEGATVEDVNTRGNCGSTKTTQNQITNNPYFSGPEGDAVAFSNASNMRSVKMMLPLECSGIFNNDSIFPTLLTNGLHISITLQEERKVFRMLDGCSRNKRTTLNPIFHSLDGSTGSPSGWATGTGNSTTFYTRVDNNQYVKENSPFCVGQEVGFVNLISGVNASFSATSGGTVEIFPKITAIENFLDGGITRVKYTIQESYNVTGADITTAQAQGNWALVDRTINRQTTYSPSYLISNVNLMVQQVRADPRYEQGMVQKMKEGGEITYDFLSTTNYKYSQQTTDRVANIRLNLNNSRMKSIISTPVCSTVFSSRDVMTASGTPTFAPDYNRDWLSHSDRPGLVGVTDFITNYNFFYSGRLQPSRSVNLEKTATKTSISSQGIIELEKALTSAGIDVHCMTDYVKNFAIGRSVAIGKNNVFDARGLDFNLQVNYQNTTNAPEFPKLWHNFVYHWRRMVIRGDSVSIEI
jgi:hypothetical protein